MKEIPLLNDGSNLLQGLITFRRMIININEITIPLINTF
jgi:hypothetical protein